MSSYCTVFLELAPKTFYFLFHTSGKSRFTTGMQKFSHTLISQSWTLKPDNHTDNQKKKIIPGLTRDHRSLSCSAATFSWIDENLIAITDERSIMHEQPQSIRWFGQIILIAHYSIINCHCIVISYQASVYLSRP